MKQTTLAVACALSLLASCGGDEASIGTPDSGSANGGNARVESDVGVMPGDASGDPTADTTVEPDLPDLPPGACRSDIDCSDGVFCNGIERCSEGVCFPSPVPQCSDPSDCTQDQCDEFNQRCEFIPDDTRCALGQVCRSKSGCFTPAQCGTDADCDDALLCNGAERCLGGQCEPGDPVECGDGIGCTLDTCVEGTGECQSVPDHTRCLAVELCVPGAGCAPRPPCMRDDDCDDGLFCNGTETCGADSVCAPGTPPMAVDTVACTIDQCSETLKTIVNTPDNARCADGAFCNGVEICHPVDGCGPGVPPVLSDGVGCTADSCNETLRVIEHAPDDSICDDGLFCNGPEVCHPFDDCSPAEPPLLSDGVGCTVDTCSEVMDVVLHVTDDTLCDDGLYCNGIEVCDPAMDCVTSSTPLVDDGIACTADTCDESADTVRHTPSDGACNSGNACTSPEVCDVGLGCIPGPPVVLDDNVMCTVDSCDPVTGVAHVPDNSLCDDDLFCNGVETCNAGTGCAGGTAPGNDNNPCTSDLCNEMTDTVSHINAVNGTVCGTAPRSICLAGTCGVSSCGDGFTDSGLGETCDPPAGGTCDSNCHTIVSSCDPDGSWTLNGTTTSYSCVFPDILNDYSITLAWSGVSFSGNAATGVVTQGRSIVQVPNPPAYSAVTFTGTGGMCPSGNFTIQKTDLADEFLGGCDEIYTLSGTFTSDNSFTGTMELTYVQVPGALLNGSCGTCGGSTAGGTVTFAVNGTRP